jgi:hypothetical protein
MGSSKFISQEILKYYLVNVDHNGMAALEVNVKGLRSDIYPLHVVEMQ